MRGKHRGREGTRRLSPGPCDARNVLAVSNLRERKYRKAKPFALMVSDVARARDVVEAHACRRTAARLPCPAGGPGPRTNRIGRRGAGQRRVRSDAALHAAAPSALRQRRAERAGDDQRQSVQRADGVRGRRRDGTPLGDRRRVPGRDASNRAPRRRFRRPRRHSRSCPSCGALAATHPVSSRRCRSTIRCWR